MLDRRQQRFLIGSGAAFIAVLSLVSLIGCGSRAKPEKIVCARGPAKPISVERVVKSLRQNGYEVTLRPNRCDVKDFAMELNAVPRVDKRALVICDVRIRPLYGSGFHQLEIGDWVQDNVQCGVYTGANPTADVAQLRAAVQSMAIR